MKRNRDQKHANLYLWFFLRTSFFVLVEIPNHLSENIITDRNSFVNYFTSATVIIFVQIVHDGVRDSVARQVRR